MMSTTYTIRRQPVYTAIAEAISPFLNRFPAVFYMDTSTICVHIDVMDREDTVDIKATLGGDGDAFGRIVSRHQKAISGRMWKFTRDRTFLEELVNDVFVEAYISLKNFKGTGPFSHWLNCIATRTGYRFWRKQKKRTEREVPLQDWDAIESDKVVLDPVEAGEVVQNLLDQLPPRDRLVLSLMYLEEMSVEEAAEHTGWSRSMVKVQAHRARKKLKTIMENSGR